MGIAMNPYFMRAKRKQAGLGSHPNVLTTTLLQGLASHWLLGEASGATRVDSHGVEDLTDNGTVPQSTQAGITGCAPASGKWLSRASNTNLLLGNRTFTFYALCYPTSLSVSGVVVTKGTVSPLALEFAIVTNQTTGKWSVNIWQGASVQALDGDTITFNQWHLVVAWQDTDANTINIQVDNGTVYSATRTQTPTDTGAAFAIGAYADAGGFPFAGTIARVGKVDRVLTTAERTALYNSGSWNTYPFLGGSALYSTVNTTDSGGQNIRILVPNNHVAGTPYVPVLYHHGVGETQTAITADALKLGVVRNLLGEGYIVAGSNAHGENWGNSASLTDYLNLYGYLNSNYTLGGRTIHFSQSMGGMSGLLSVITDFVNIPYTKGWIGCYPVCNLADMFNNNAGTFAGDIRAAYGIAADGSDYAAKTAGHDPVLLTASKFDGLRMRFYASASDTVVNKTNNTDQMRTLVTGHATEFALVTCTGDHGDLSHFRPVDYSDFVNRCL